jgi:hypothetical protein
MEKSSRACWTDLRIGILNCVIIAENGAKGTRGRSPMDCKGSNLGKFYISTERSWSKYLKLHIFRGEYNASRRNFASPNKQSISISISIVGGCLFSANQTNALGRKEAPACNLASHHIHGCELTIYIHPPRAPPPPPPPPSYHRSFV